ncbi:MAG TPA: orotidine-5'-phosphate decarboxylase [Atribacteraceae bacterium]|nr:orotidine-5'-phosphate decarboxylase [Atribacteraceae bacterium]
MNFADRVCAVVDTQGPLVVGLDPHLSLMPRFLMEKDSGERADTFEKISSAVLDGNRIVLRALRDIAGIVKIQMALYEMLGLPGLSTLVETCREAREMEYLVILDGKRNDISSTARGYATGYLSSVSVFDDLKIPSFWQVDAMTVNPYLGEDGLLPFFDEASRSEKGVFVLCRTSNPSASFVQDEGKGEKLFFKVANLVEELGKPLVGERGLSSAGIVVGATYPADLKDLRKRHPSLLFLVPGIGAQQGDLEALRFAFREDRQGVLVNVSRDILYAYRESGDRYGQDFGEKARIRAREYQDRLLALGRR